MCQNKIKIIERTKKGPCTKAGPSVRLEVHSGCLWRLGENEERNGFCVFFFFKKSNLRGDIRKATISGTVLIKKVYKPSRWWPSDKNLGSRGLLLLWSQVRAMWLLIWWPLEVYMIVNFRARGISRGTRKLPGYSR